MLCYLLNSVYAPIYKSSAQEQIATISHCPAYVAGLHGLPQENGLRFASEIPLKKVSSYILRSSKNI